MKLSLVFTLISLLILSRAQAQTPVPGAATPPGVPPSATAAPPANAPPTQPPAATSPMPVTPIAAIDGLSRRDPFKLPEYLVIKIRQKLAENSGPAAGTIVIDDSVEPIRRWPLGNYLLVGIIWDVKKPKAMFTDKMNNIHVLQINDFIGNAKGVIVGIQNGSVTVLEGKIPQVIKLKK